MALVTKKDLKAFSTISVPITCIMLTLVELVLSWLAPIPDPFEKYKKFAPNNSLYIESQFKPYSKFTFEIEEKLPHMDSKVEFTTNNMGFRGDLLTVPKPKNEYRVFLIGGSTTENLFIDDQWGLERQIQSRLQDSVKNKTIKVYNAGKSGDATPDHLAMLTFRIIHLRPDLIVLFPGINDLNRLVRNYDYLHFPKSEEDRKNTFVRDLKFFLSNSQIFRRLINVMNRNETNARSAIYLKTNYKEKVQEVSKLPLMEEFPHLDFNIFRRNIQSFVGIAQAHHIPLLLLTQTHTWNNDSDEYLKANHWMTGTGDYRFPERDLADALGIINQILLETASQSGMISLDLEKQIPKTSDYFYDDCHFNKMGVEKSSEIISNSILKNFSFK